eukprot:scaffold346500_cov35-Prasinocladus_malaysianus.AAC.1
MLRFARVSCRGASCNNTAAEVKRACGGVPGASGPEVSSAARAMALVSQMVEFFRGSRVESYAPLVALLGRLVSPTKPRMLDGSDPHMEAAQEYDAGMMGWIAMQCDD